MVPGRRRSLGVIIPISSTVSIRLAAAGVTVPRTRAGETLAGTELGRLSRPVLVPIGNLTLSSWQQGRAALKNPPRRTAAWGRPGPVMAAVIKRRRFAGATVTRAVKTFDSHRGIPFRCSGHDSDGGHKNPPQPSRPCLPVSLGSSHSAILSDLATRRLGPGDSGLIPQDRLRSHCSCASSSIIFMIRLGCTAQANILSSLVSRFAATILLFE